MCPHEGRDLQNGQCSTHGPPNQQKPKHRWPHRTQSLRKPLGSSTTQKSANSSERPCRRRINPIGKRHLHDVHVVTLECSSQCRNPHLDDVDVGGDVPGVPQERPLRLEVARDVTGLLQRSLQPVQALLARLPCRLRRMQPPAQLLLQVIGLRAAGGNTLNVSLEALP